MEEKVNEQELIKLQNNYISKLNTDIEYSLEVDPTNKYEMAETQKDFIKNYIEFKNIYTAAELSGIEPDLAKQYFVAYSSQQEIRRINKALYQRQFANKLLNLDELGGYLSSLITDENVPIGDRLKTTDKLKVVNMIIELIKLKKEAFDNPNSIVNENLEDEMKDLSVTTIEQLLSNINIKNNKKNKKKKYETDEIIIENEDDNLSIEEKAYLRTLPTRDLLNLINNIKEKK